MIGSASAERVEVGGCTRRGANSMAVYGLVSRSNLVGTGRAISILFGINGVRNKQSRLVGPPFPAFKARISAMAGWHFSRANPNPNLSRHWQVWLESRIC